MKLLYKLFVLCIVLSCCVFNSYSQEEGWTLGQCIDYAITHNIEVRQKQLAKENTEISLNTSRMSRLPDLNADAGQGFYFGRGPGREGNYIDQSQANTSLSVSSSIPIFTGMRIYNEVKAGKMDLLASVENLNKAKEDISLRVTSYFFQVLFNRELLEIARKQVELSKEQVVKTEALVAAGKNPESAVYDSKATLASDELAYTQAANDLTLALLDLAQLLNLPASKTFDVSAPDIERMEVEQLASLVRPDSLYAFTVDRRPGIRAARFSLESSKYEVKVAQSGFYPTLSLGGSYSTGYYHSYSSESVNDAFGNQLKNNSSENVRLSLNIPIFNRLATRNRVKQAKVQVLQQSLMLEDAEQALYKEIEQAYYTAVAAHKKLSSSRQAVKAARISMEYEQIKYGAGKSTSFEYNDVKTRYEKALSDEAQARYEYLFRTKILDFYNGKPLSE
ncbi:TolC family protein [Barnesiella propionica]|uniref:TolC family protein n=1 Tax=Barnesiella propionica TaxID=2981781 RepID=UPI0011C8668D|nr:TolC family protein [Barnesiella propionica]MCU6769851.1 TolC family protein [Barnesiella propionica]